jgi:hypothetical protein
MSEAVQKRKGSEISEVVQVKDNYFQSLRFKKKVGQGIILTVLF